MGRTMPFDCPGCGKVLDWGDFGPSGNDPDRVELDKPQCTCHGWEWNGEWWAMLADAPESAAETLPNPYATTVDVREGLGGSWWAHVTIDGTDTDPIDGHIHPTHIWLKFTHAADAHRHAALILSALHKAVME